MQNQLNKTIKNVLYTIDNSTDESRVYDITADVSVYEQTRIDSISSGNVFKDNVTVANFSCYGNTDNINVQYTGVELAQQSTVLEAIVSFVTSIKEQLQVDTPIEDPATTEILNQQIKLSRMTINTLSLTDEQSLEVKDLYPNWSDLIGQQVNVDFKFVYENVLYKVLQQHTLQEQWIPGIDTASLYTVISANAQEEHAGTKEDPIPYVQNMILEKDKYYTQDGVLYICIQSTLTGYPNDLKDLVSIVQRVEE